MRILTALKNAADRGEFGYDVVQTAADRLWVGLWREDRDTSDESVMGELLGSIVPGGWGKWKYVCLLIGANTDNFGS